MRPSLLCFAVLAVAVLSVLPVSLSQLVTATYQWGYVLRCAPNTLDYPCLIQVTGTATVNSTVGYSGAISETINGTTTRFTAVPYYNMVGFAGTRNFTNRFGQSYVASIQLPTTGTRATTTNLYLNAPWLNSQGFLFANNATNQFYGGLLATEWYVSNNPYASETIVLLGAGNALNNDYTMTLVCSNAPGFVAAAYNASDDNPTTFATMAPCTNPPFSRMAAPALPAAGTLLAFNFAYSTTDGTSYSVSVNSTLYTDGSINYDQLGNPYYNVIQMLGSRTYTYLPTGAISTVAITSLMAQNIIASSNLAYITNNNRLYTQYPYLDRYGIAYTLASPVAVDGSSSGTQVIQAVYVYREDTIEEESLNGDAFPPTNTNNVLEPISLTPIAVPSTYQLVQWCYSFQGLPQTTDYPWLVVTSGTALIDSTMRSGNITTNTPSTYYNMLGFVGTRNYTNKYGQHFVNSLTLDPLGEDRATNYLFLNSPYAGGVAFHINGTIQVPGGLPATDISVYLNPYPIEGTGYGYGVGTGTNALNNDPSKTIFASNAPSFATSGFSNNAGYTTAGTVVGSTSIAACINPAFTTVANVAPAAGVQVFLFQYGFLAPTYSVNASLTVITDGAVNIDALGNYYFNVAALFGTHSYAFGGVTYNTTIASLMPVCSGPSVSNLDNVYCNNNRLYPQYPYIDRLGLAYEFGTAQASDGSAVSTTRYGGVYIYRHTVLEEAAPASYPNFSDAPPQSISLTPVSGTTYTAVQWGYKLTCANRTLDYPCTVSVVGTAIVASTTSATRTTSCTTYNCNVPYLTVVGFIGTRTFYGRYGSVLVQNVSLAPSNEEFSDDYLYLNTPYVDTDGFTYYLNGTDGALTEFQGGLFGNEVNFALYPFATESIAINAGSGNTLYYDPAGAVICSNAPGFTAYTFSSATPRNVAGSTNMADCAGTRYSTNAPAVYTQAGLRAYNLTYSVSDGVTYVSNVTATLFTDGTVNYDSLGNVYYNAIAATGTRVYTYLSTGLVSVQHITSLMAQNIVPTSNLAYITNNNRLYPYYPYFDRYGMAFTLDSNIAPDGVVITSATTTTDILSVVVYRDNTFEEYTIFGGGNYPPTNSNNTQLPLSLVKVVPPATYQLVTYCYVFYGLNNTIDYPWSVVVSGTALIDNSTLAYVNASQSTTTISNIPYYNMIGFVGTRNFTNKYGQNFVNTLTLNALGEDYDSNQLWLATPYAGGLSFHINGTIQTPGGLPATDIEVFLDPYPIEGTAYGYGVGGGSNALNNDPSKTVFASNAPGFTPSVYSNNPLSSITAASIGTVYGTNDVTQCVAYFPVLRNTAPAAGIRVYSFQYTITNTRYYLVQANYLLTTDGAVNVDALGNYYFNVAAMSGYRTYTYYPTGVVSVANVTALMPICSGPSVSNLNNVYCNNNRLYLSYPYVDRLGLAYEFGSTVANAGLVTGGTAYGGVYSYRETAVEEARSSQYPTWSDNVNQTVTLTQVMTTTYQTVQWGYKMQCANNTLDYPCTVSVIGTAVIASNVSAAFTSGCTYHNCYTPYYQMIGFIGTRTFYNRFGRTYVQNVSLAQNGEDYGDQLLYLATPYIDGDGVTIYLNGTDGALTQFPGGLFGNEINLFLDPYATETLAVNGGPSNALFFDPAGTVFCSTASGFQANTYNAAVPKNSSGSTNMADCAGSRYTQSTSSSQTGLGLRAYNFSYTTSVPNQWSATVAATLFTDGTVNYDQLGNVYYNVIAITGTRSYTFNSSGNVITNVTTITSLMAQNIVPTSNRPDITNNNRLYPVYPFLDRYGIAFTLSANTAPDGSSAGTTDIVCAYVYRDNTLEEYTLLGGAYPATNTANDLEPISLVKVVPPATYQLVQWCYVLYGLPGTLDYPWSVVTTGTALIDNSTVQSTTSTNGYSIGAINYYPMIGFIGTRTFTNRYGQNYANTVTLNAIGEDHAVNQLWLQSPYAGGISFHINGTIQTPGGLPATDMEIFLDPYPIEGTAYGYGVGGGSNALNNDPSKTVFATNAPNFVSSVYSNLDLTQINSTSVGSVYGTSDMTQCRASFTTVSRSVPAAGVRVYQFNYQLFGSNNNFAAVANLTLVTDGTVNIDGLGNYYFNVAAINGTRTYTWYPTNNVTVYNVVALSPVCSGPSVSNLDNVYCNSNRLYPQYPYIDRLGLAFQFSKPAPRAGAAPGLSTSLYAGVYVYREDVIEEANPVSGGYPNWSDNPNQYISLVNVGATFTSPLYYAYQWGYLMQCANGSLDYPCAVSVIATVLVTNSSLTTTPSGVAAYVASGLIGTRTYVNRYGQRFVSNISLAAFGEDYNDDLLVLAAPFSDSDGITFRLNGTDGALTEMPGGVLGNEINVYLNPYPVETISNAGANVNSLQTDPAKTVYCSTLPGFVASAYSATTSYAAGSTVMSSCNAPVLSQSRTTASPAGTFSLSYNISDGINFIALVSFTATPDGQLYYDGLGNQYWNVSYITGARVYIDIKTGAFTVSNITGVARSGNFSTGGGQLNSNRVYPQRPYFDREGLTLLVTPNTPTSGTTNQSRAANTSYFTIYNYRENFIEESPARSFPNLNYQYIQLVAGAVPPINLSAYNVNPGTIPIYTPSSSSSSSSTAGPRGGVSSSSTAAGPASTVSSSSSSSSSTGSAGGTNGTTNAGSSDSGLSGGQIAGIVIGSVVGGLLLLGICVFVLLSAGGRKQTTKTGDSEDSKVQGASVIAPSEISRTTGTRPLQPGEPVTVVEMQPMHTEAQEV